MAGASLTIPRKAGGAEAPRSVLAPLILLACCLAGLAGADLSPNALIAGNVGGSLEGQKGGAAESAVPEWAHSLEAALALVGDGRGGAKGARPGAAGSAPAAGQGRVGSGRARVPEEGRAEAAAAQQHTAPALQIRSDVALASPGDQAYVQISVERVSENEGWVKEGGAGGAGEGADRVSVALEVGGGGRQGSEEGEKVPLERTAHGLFEGRDLRALKRAVASRRRRRVKKAPGSSRQVGIRRGAGMEVSLGMVARDRQTAAELKRRQNAKNKKTKRRTRKPKRRRRKVVKRPRRASPPPPPRTTRSPPSSPPSHFRSPPRRYSPPPDSTPPGPAADVSITVTAFDRARQYVIHPGVYGTNDYRAAPFDVLAQAGIRLVRKGGNKDTRYNWEVDATNRASDWFYESLPNEQVGGVSSFDQFVQDCKANGITAMAQIPMLEWLPKSRQPACSFSVMKYGPQAKTAPDHADCGNGMRTNSKTGKEEPITNNDPTDTAVKKGPTHQNVWVSNIAKQHGSSASGGVRFYGLDNEPPWWSYVHRDIHPQPSTYDEILTRGIAYAEAIKAADPTALVTGPVSGGWSDVFYSITDFQEGWKTGPEYKYYSNPVDRKAHGGVPFMEYYLQGMASYEHRHGLRLLDVVDVHAYITPGNDKTDPDSQARRVEATRVFWDPAYVCDPSVCDFMDARLTATDGVPKFLVRLQKMIKHRYPGTGLAVTEYDFGGNQDPSGAVAQAEALGIFGKFNVSAASLHPGLTASSSKYQAFKMYGNYDSRGNSFGSIGVGAHTSDSTKVSVYAALTEDKGTLTVMLINLTPKRRTTSLRLADVRPSKPVRAFRYDGVSSANIVQLDSLKPATRYSLALSGYSLTLLEVAVA